VLVWIEVETGFEPVYAALQAAASPLGHSTVKAVILRADDRARTGDLNLGKVALYQLSYVRTNISGVTSPLDACQTVADRPLDSKTAALPRDASAGPR
jgi:hypothetical protein